MDFVALCATLPHFLLCCLKTSTVITTKYFYQGCQLFNLIWSEVFVIAEVVMEHFMSRPSVTLSTAAVGGHINRVKSIIMVDDGYVWWISITGDLCHCCQESLRLVSVCAPFKAINVFFALRNIRCGESIWKVLIGWVSRSVHESWRPCHIVLMVKHNSPTTYLIQSHVLTLFMHLPRGLLGKSP